jgi:hypothetical protein
MDTVPSSPTPSTPDLVAIAAATELDFRLALDCDDLAALRRAVGGMSGRTQGVLAIAAQLLAERDEARRLLTVIAKEHGHPRTDRHGSGCVSCGLVWPCPTYVTATGGGTDD